jgi:hypothetical protein
MLPRAFATGYHRISDGGRNRPLLVTVETDDGAEHDVYLKPSERPNMSLSGLICEYMAACLAGDLGLPIPKAFLVELDETFIRSIPHPDLQALLFDGSPLSFGSKIDGGGWRDWGQGDRLSADQWPVALKILVFDMLTGNQDRLGNPSNILIRNHEIRIIDHELAFRYAGAEHQPWTLGACQALRHGNQGHVFAPALAGKQLDFSPVQADWSRLTPARIMSYVAALPPEWDARRDIAEGAADLLSQALARINDCLAEIQRALS